MKKNKKSEWIIRATYNSDNWKKYCEVSYPFKGTPKQLENRIGNTTMKSMKNMVKQKQLP